MNKKIKIFTVGLIALVGLFASFNTASARTPNVTCNSATIYGNVWPNGTSVEAWFEWGTDRGTVQNGNGTRTSSQTITYNREVSAYLSGLTQDTTYYYRLAMTTNGTYVPATTESFTTSTCQAKTYTVDTNAGIGGTISPDSRIVTAGNTTTFSITPDVNYTINSVSGCNGHLSGKIYTTGSINSNCTVTANFKANPVSPTTVNIVADPNSVPYNGKSTITWYPNNATSCTASGGSDGWAGPRSTTQGSFLTGPLTVNTIFYIKCMGNGGTTPQKSVTVNVANQPALNPSVNLVADPTNIKRGESSSLSWTTENAISCSASWTTSSATSGYKTVSPTSTTDYSITCYGASGTTPAHDSARVTVSNVLQPSVNLVADPTSIKKGESSTLSWTTNNATSCSASWLSSTATGGSKTVYPTSTTDYSITCYGASGTTPAHDSARVTVGTQTTVTGSLAIHPSSCVIDAGQSTCTVGATWVTSYATAPKLIDRNTNSTLSTEDNRYSPLTVWVTYPQTTFDLKNNNTILDSKTATASCASDTTWNGRTCATNILNSPTVNLTADSLSIKYNGSTTLRWTTTNNPTSCTASGAWSGSKSPSGGNYSTGNLTSSKTYEITCYGASGTTPAHDSVTVEVSEKIKNPTPANPTVSLSANPPSIKSGEYSVLVWSSEGTTSCSASWLPSTATGGSKTVYPTETTTYSITCTGAGKNVVDSVDVNVTKGQPTPGDPTIEIFADDPELSYNGSTNIRWNSENATSCTGNGGSNGWAGSKSLASIFYTGKLTSDTTYNITCKNSAGKSVSDSVKVFVGNQQAPIVSLFADNSNLSYGGSTNIRWTSENATSCTGNGGSSGWTNYKGLSGIFYTGKLTSDTTYNITCKNAKGESSSASETVSVGNLDIGDLTVDIFAEDVSVIHGGSTNIRWNSENATSCTANGGSNGWMNSKALSGIFYTGPLTITTTYNITCKNAAGRMVSGSVKVNVDGQVGSNPSVSIFADDGDISSGDSTNVRWNSTNAVSCTANAGSNGWSGSKGLAGIFYTGRLTRDTTYNITCKGSTGAAASDSVTVMVEGDNNDNNDDETDPTVTTRAATNIDDESATLNGFVDSNNGSNVRAWFEWGTNSRYGNSTSHINYGSTSGTNFDYDLDGLDTDETYYFRAVAENNSGQRVYGSQKTFTTDENGNNNDNNDEPDVTTYSASEIDTDSATLNGYVDTNGTSTRRWFEWGTRSGSLYNETDKSSRSTSSRNFEQTIYNLSPNTTYYFRAAAENNNGTDYGNVLSFRTENNGNIIDDNTCDYGNCAPTAVTTMATNIGQSSARLNGLGLVSNNVYTTGYFEYGTSQALGRTTVVKNIGSTQSNPYYESLFSLASGVTYYYRAVVTNQYGTSRGDIISFRTGSAITYVDTNTNTNTVYRNTTVVTNTNDNTGTARPSLVFLTVSRNDETLARGDTVEYIVNYKNVSSKDLRSVILQVHIPKELEFIETSRGYFSTENSTVVVNIGDLNSQEEGSVSIRVKVTTDAEIGKIVVVTANLAYTIIETDIQEEVFAYSKNTVEERGEVQLGALAFLFGGNFLPNTLLGWLLLILLIVLVILAIRKAYYGPRTIFVPESLDKNHG